MDFELGRALARIVLPASVSLATWLVRRRCAEPSRSWTSVSPSVTY